MAFNCKFLSHTWLWNSNPLSDTSTFNVLVVFNNCCLALVKFSISVCFIFLLELDQIPQGLGHQVLNSLLQAVNSQQHFQMLAPELKKALLAQVLTRMHRNEISTFPGSASNFDSPNMMLDKMELSAKDRQVSGNNDFQVPDDWFPYLSKKLEL